MRQHYFLLITPKHSIPYTEERWKSLQKNCYHDNDALQNHKSNDHLPDGDTDFFDIVAGVLQEDMLALYLFIICQDYLLQMSIDLIKENGFTLKKTRSIKTMTDAD